MPSPSDPLCLQDPDRGERTPVSQIVESHLKARGRDRPFAPASLESLWSAEYFGLHRVRLFQQGNEEQQRQVLRNCARGLLNEAYFIEKSGAAYCAKMILLADTTEVRQVYSLIASDEASHLQWIRPFVLESDRDQPGGPLLRFLSDLVERCDRNTLPYLVQVILEGWGLHHYRSLAKSCLHPELRTVFHSIHQDEALHKHTGEVLFDPSQVTAAEQKTLVKDSLHAYTEMVRIGPQAVVSAVDEVFGGLSRGDKIAVFAELETEARSQEKLELLRELMSGPGRERYLAELDESGAFTPYSPEACAAIHG